LNGVHFHDLSWLHGMWLLPFLAGVFLYRFHRKDRALRRFAQARLLAEINIRTSRARQWGKALLVLGSVFFILAALTRPAWNLRPQEAKHRGRDIVFLLDASRSMLAEDLAPNRLERARLAILDLVDRLEGDRVALVAFAGHAVVKCPLTLDYGFFRLALDDIGVESVSRGGTLIGDALRTTLDDVLTDRLHRFKDIVLITDGEDHESFPVEAAQEAGNRGVRLIAVGLGDESEGRRIPVSNEKGERVFLKHEGREVWTRLDADTLRRMVRATPGGRYLNVATGAFDLGRIYEKFVQNAEKRELESRTVRRYEEKFQIFIALAMIFLLAETSISERKKERSS